MVFTGYRPYRLRFLGEPMNDKQMKEAIRTRDGHRCRVCGIADEDHASTFGRGLEVCRIPPATAFRLDATCVTVCRECGARLRAEAKRQRQCSA